MAATHDYNTFEVPADGLDANDVLVGQSGGLSAVYAVRWQLTTGVTIVETEHGDLHLPEGRMVEVLVA